MRSCLSSDGRQKVNVKLSVCFILIQCAAEKTDSSLSSINSSKASVSKQGIPADLTIELAQHSSKGWVTSHRSLLGGTPASWVLSKAVSFNFTRHKAGSATVQKTTQQCSPASHCSISPLHESQKKRSNSLTPLNVVSSFGETELLPLC